MITSYILREMGVCMCRMSDSYDTYIHPSLTVWCYHRLPLSRTLSSNNPNDNMFFDFISKNHERYHSYDTYIHPSHDIYNVTIVCLCHELYRQTIIMITCCSTLSSKNHERYHSYNTYIHPSLSIYNVTIVCICHELYRRRITNTITHTKHTYTHLSVCMMLLSFVSVTNCIVE